MVTKRAQPSFASVVAGRPSSSAASFALPSLLPAANAPPPPTTVIFNVDDEVEEHITVPQKRVLAAAAAGVTSAVSASIGSAHKARRPPSKDRLLIFAGSNASSSASPATRPREVNTTATKAAAKEVIIPSAAAVDAAVSNPSATTVVTLPSSLSPFPSPPPPRDAATTALGGYHNPHWLPMKYLIGDLSRIRPELRGSGRYSPTDSIAALIPNGDRTATTRRPPAGVAVGSFISFGSQCEGLYQVVDFTKVDLRTAAGVEEWSRREGWSAEAAFSFGSQVSTGKTQMLFTRVA